MGSRWPASCNIITSTSGVPTTPYQIIEAISGEQLNPEPPPDNGEFHISEVNPWTQTPISVGIGTFAVPLSTYILIKTQLKGVPTPSSYKEACIRTGHI